MLNANMPYLNDEEGLHVPAGLPPLIDTHVHIFPWKISTAVRKWFDENAWHIRYRLKSSQIFAFLLARGIHHIIALQYAHKPGIARQLNAYMAEKCREFPGQVTGLGTVFPGEEEAEKIAQDAFDLGLRGLKLHAHVQCFDMNAGYMDCLYDCCDRNGVPIVMHVGREPKSRSYKCDTYQLCNAGKLERVVREFPRLKICVPHLGFDETAAYRELIEKYENLWLDTTMVITDYFPVGEKVDLSRYRPDRVMYGSDFPSIPYAWDREVRALQEAAISAETLAKICSNNAVDFFNIPL